MTERQGKWIRRSLGTLLLMTMALVSVPMILGATRALSQGTARDPFSGLVYEENKLAFDACIELGSALIQESKLIETDEQWQQAMVKFQSCRSQTPELYRRLAGKKF